MIWKILVFNLLILDVCVCFNIDDLFRITATRDSNPSFQSRNLCRNKYGDIGICVEPLECLATRGLNVGICNLNGGLLKNKGVCCRFLPCSGPEFERPDESRFQAVFNIGLRNARDVSRMMGFTSSSTTILPAKLQSCGVRDQSTSRSFSEGSFRPNSNSNSVISSRFRRELREQQLINGRPVLDQGGNGFPWMLALWVKTKSGFNVPSCGAALISSSNAITAAHCVSDLTQVYVLRGGSSINRLDFAVNNANTFSSGTGTGVILEVASILIHPDFNPFNFENDIALIKLKLPVSFSRDLFPICLPPPTINNQTTDYSGEFATVSGWGCVEENCNLANVPIVLQETEIPVIPNDLAMCWFMNDSTKRGRSEYIPSQLFIVGGDESGSTSTCRGDSGSPVVRGRRQIGMGHSNKWEVIGLVSWSKGCGRPFRPSVWTRVESFVRWLMDNMDL